MESGAPYHIPGGDDGPHYPRPDHSNYQPSAYRAQPPACKSKSDQTGGKTNCTTNVGNVASLVAGVGGTVWEIWEIISNKCILAQTIKAKDQESQSIFYVLTLSLAVSNL